MSAPDAAVPNPYAPPGVEMAVEAPTPGSVPALWNPDAAGAWSLVFSPIFGSALVLKNWQTLGQGLEVKLAWMWLAASILLLIIASFVPGLSLLNFLYIIVWYFAWQKKQTDYVKKRWGKDYIRKGWAIPLLCALAGLVVFSVVIFFVEILLRR
jgi:hypothetical protein